jgi:hypothetical protein
MKMMLMALSRVFEIRDDERGSVDAKSKPYGRREVWSKM